MSTYLDQLLTQSEKPQNLHHIRNATFERGGHEIPQHRQVNNYVSRIRSVKAGMKTIMTESFLEADEIYLAEGNPDVVKIASQHLRINIRHRNRPYFTLDITEWYKTKEEIHYEMKDSRKLVRIADGRDVPDGWQILETFARHHGLSLKFKTEHDIEPHRILIDNWRELLRWVYESHERPDSYLESEILRISSDEGAICFHDFYRHIATSDHAGVARVLANLLHQGIFDAELDTKPFSMNSIVRFAA